MLRFGSMFVKVPKSRKVSSRALWTAANSGYYDKVTASERYVLTTHGFTSCTFKGLPLLKQPSSPKQASVRPPYSVMGLLMNPWLEKCVVRGQSNAESMSALNRQMKGILGRAKLFVFKDDKLKELDVEATRKNMLKHQDGDIKGVSTTLKFWTGFSFGNWLGKGNEMLVFNTLNIPQTQQQFQIYERTDAQLSVTGDTMDYSGESELTLSAAHCSTVLGKVQRPGFLSLSMELNPMYVDVETLSPDLREKYQDLMTHFYVTVYMIWDNPKDKPALVKEFQMAQKDFYKDFVIESILGKDPLRVAAIEQELGGLDLDLTQRVTLGS
ncbi:hypothetical protein [Legionella waltersii]|uniref:Uncharacterized protein n=2 Tax=Legionella waltersii TaxID=66969 RepID=A0A0W1AAQ4_9GAMM|nr:hypothetical protein [Legionella waltersii]KTD78444.1 hypothetical protein Lwal_1879 [Legionella waltersii]SNV06008.1 Uncharacterised protein [Legionella waltersii]